MIRRCYQPSALPRTGLDDAGRAAHTPADEPLYSTPCPHHTVGKSAGLAQCDGLGGELAGGPHPEHAQLQSLLVCVDDWINDAVAENMWRHGGGMSRADRSELEWLLAASDHWHEEESALSFSANWRDVLYVFAQ